VKEIFLLSCQRLRVGRRRVGSISATSAEEAEGERQSDLCSLLRVLKKRDSVLPKPE